MVNSIMYLLCMLFLALKYKKLFTKIIPISLCNIVYKIITKILANKLKLCFPRSSLLYNLFVPSRNIQDNTILAHELLHYFKNTKRERRFHVSQYGHEESF
jgi:hypothetical protein